MAAMTDYLKTKILTTDFPTMHVGLLKSDVETNEVTGGGYVRKPVKLTKDTDNSYKNNAIITFPEATAEWGQITHIAIFDQESTGKALFIGAANGTPTITKGTEFSIPLKQLIVTIN